MMEDYRRQCRHYHGDRYRLRTSPYASIINLRMKQSGKGPIECAIELLGLLRGKYTVKGMKLGGHVKALLYSAALDIEEGKVEFQAS